MKNTLLYRARVRVSILTPLEAYSRGFITYGVASSSDDFNRKAHPNHVTYFCYVNDRYAGLAFSNNVSAELRSNNRLFAGVEAEYLSS